MTTIVTQSDDVNIPVTLKIDGAVQDVSLASVINASLTSRDGQTSYGTAVQTNTGGADWANGIVEVVIPAASTGTVPAGGIRLEIQVTLSSLKTTYYSDAVEGRVGTIA